MIAIRKFCSQTLHHYELAGHTPTEALHQLCPDLDEVPFGQITWTDLEANFYLEIKFYLVNGEIKVENSTQTQPNSKK